MITALMDPVVTLDFTLHQKALVLAEHYRLSICDSLVLAAALSADCTLLLSEDFQHGQLIGDRLRIVNPFASPA